VRWKKHLKPKRVVLSIGVILFALFLTNFFFFSLERLTLKSYQETIQQILFQISIFTSFLVLLIYLVKRKFMKALLGCLLPLLIYLLINFIFESILYITESLQQWEELTLEEGILKNINVGIGDLKIVLTIIAIILWCWVWLKI